MIIAYARVSSTDQNLDRQMEEFKRHGAGKIFVEKKSGTNVINREEFNRALNFAHKDDFFMVEAIDQLGRNYTEIVQTVNFLKEKNVGLLVTSVPLLSEPLADPLLDKFVKDLILQLLAMIAERERTESKRRQAQGIAIAKEKGVYKGRPKLYTANAKDPQKQAVYHQIVRMLNDGLSIKAIAEKNSVTRMTVYRIKKELDSNLSSELIDS
ncbi:recombinase family protein [Listeria sp. FSL L7-1509]|uniref:Recombinase family protein n=1 Tax=Listeria immobilis TaxID=2713502 RepID=A0ABR6STY0_9LIST|nr:recombinase family protein [Listeria immobilis]MBC1482052.1 recombinase family protein [Listeria immobilis]MBC1505442.1 recombinase family protein [Listeria immobilis]MBC1509125.1 recombinase family protein [Listeria immobilis]MBC6303926.1 recombinase family protein [Listeria immobilis]MBC6312264.1 recombinase family protein [Listeria immobilis]